MLFSRAIDFRGIVRNGFVLIFGFTVWRVLFNNYGKEVFDISAAEIGLIQAIREVPGLLGFTVGLLALWLAEVHIATLAIALTGAGLIMCGLADSVFMLGVGTLVMSVGFHHLVTANYSLLLYFIRGPESGRRQGILGSWESLAAVIATLLIFLTSLLLGYRVLFAGTGAILLLYGLIFTFRFRSNRAAAEIRAFNIKKQYWLYYVISFMRGCRRHIFTTFAIFLLVANYGLRIEYTALLYLATSTVTIFTRRLLGNLTESIGERAVLVTTSFLLFFIFCGYALIPWLWPLIVLFLVDHVLFGSSIALQSYIRKVALPADLTNCLSFGQTANHISAVSIPIIGGIMWETLGYRTTFLLGAVIVAADFCFALLVNPRKHSLVVREAAGENPLVQ
jgi:predicted MFS family arabinose efflux permease